MLASKDYLPLGLRSSRVFKYSCALVLYEVKRLIKINYYCALRCVGSTIQDTRFKQLF